MRHFQRILGSLGDFDRLTDVVMLSWGSNITWYGWYSRGTIDAHEFSSMVHRRNEDSPFSKSRQPKKNENKNKNLPRRVICSTGPFPDSWPGNLFPCCCHGSWWSQRHKGAFKKAKQNEGNATEVTTCSVRLPKQVLKLTWLLWLIGHIEHFSILFLDHSLGLRIDPVMKTPGWKQSGSTWDLAGHCHHCQTAGHTYCRAAGAKVTRLSLGCNASSTADLQFDSETQQTAYGPQTQLPLSRVSRDPNFSCWSKT